MAYKEKRTTIKLPPSLEEIITSLNLPGSLTERAIWLIQEGIAGHPEIRRTSTE